jgi:uncharacterized protein (TIGR02284 family)
MAPPGEHHTAGGALMAPMSNAEVAGVLNELLETCYDGLDGFRTAITEIDNDDVIAFCQSRIQRIDEAAADLYTAIQHLGAHPAEHGHPTARMHRGWIQLRAALTSGNAAILAEIERGEVIAAKHYRSALAKPLPEAIHDMVEEQAQGADENLERIRSLRETVR